MVDLVRASRQQCIALGLAATALGGLGCGSAAHDDGERRQSNSSAADDASQSDTSQRGPGEQDSPSSDSSSDDSPEVGDAQSAAPSEQAPPPARESVSELAAPAETSTNEMPASTIAPSDPAAPPGASTTGDTVYPIIDGDFIIAPGDFDQPLCDLGGGVPVVQVCVELSAEDSDCSRLGYNSDELMAAANENYNCGHPWTAGILCGPAKKETQSADFCCWEMDGYCDETQELSSMPRTVAPAPRVPGPLPVPGGCDEPDDSGAVQPNYPVVSGDFLFSPGTLDSPLCDLGGGVPEVRACVPLTSPEEQCSDLMADTAQILRAAGDSFTCDRSWNAGILCGPARLESASGAACCWEMDGTFSEPTPGAPGDTRVVAPAPRMPGAPAPDGCEGSTDAEPLQPNYPVVSGDFEFSPGDPAAALCDLGGGVPEVRACVRLTSPDEQCSDLLLLDWDELVFAAADNFTCDGSWGPGIGCGPARTETESGAACCWELDGFFDSEL